MKHSKLFLTGMAALLLSFGLMMTGCDSGGDSDDGDPINAGDYIDIAVETAGADAVGANSPVAAVYTVTVKQPVPTTNKAVFANVATADVVYGPPADAEDTPAKQATAIVTKINAAAGALYIAAVGTTPGTDDHIITLTANTAGAIANAPAVAIETYEAPQTSDVTGATTANVTDGHTALAVTAGSGGFKTTGIKVYINSTGETVTISGSTLTGAGTDFTSGTIVSTGGTIVVKGLTAADTSGGAAKLKSGVKTNIVIKADAQASQVTGVAAHTGVPVVVPDNAAYEFVAAAGAGAANIYFATSPLSLNIDNTAVPINADIDAELIAVLSNLVDTDTVKFDANGNANAVVFTVAPTAAAPGAAAKLQAVLDNVGGTIPVVTLAAADNTGLASFTVPTGTTLAVTGAAFGTAGGAVVTVDGTLAVGDGTNDAILSKAVFTTAAAPNAALGVGTSGTITLAAGDTLALANTGAVTIAGTGTLALPNSVFAEGTYTATGTVTINAKAAGDEIVTGTNAGDGLVMTGAVSLLTQGTTAATYTLKANNAGDAFVTFGGTSAAATKVVAPIDSGTTCGAGIEGSATASIVLGAGTIELGGHNTTSAKRGYLELVQGATIGVFDRAVAGAVNTTVTAVGDCVVHTTKKKGALASGTITVGTAGLRLDGKDADAAPGGLIKADLASVTTDS